MPSGIRTGEEKLSAEEVLRRNRASSLKWYYRNKAKKKLAFRRWALRNKGKRDDYQEKWHASNPDYRRRYYIETIVMDRLTKKERSILMSKIRCISVLERAARPLAMALAGCRLVHQPKGLLGKPDYANKTRKIIVRIQGCFLHCCPAHGSVPKSNRAFWKKKLRSNVKRDRKQKALYTRLGWTVIDLWEHDVRKAAAGHSRKKRK